MVCVIGDMVVLVLGVDLFNGWTLLVSKWPRLEQKIQSNKGS